ncbi:putative lipoprotein [Leptospira interrogans serovar Grippotyphosa str. Andaman]|nr:putative lipoprotein [Leptospira interrogans serovar Grippotyphosa str. Andaman]
MSKIKKMILTLIHIGMTLSISCFYTGYYFRFRKNSLHRIFNLFGTMFNLTTAFSLLYLKYLGGGLEKIGIFPAVERWIIDTHRVFALLTLVLMLLMVWSGITRKKEFHRLV